MKIFETVTIIGVGLIGGSIGLAVKDRGTAGQVIGVFRHASTMSKARKAGAVDRATMDLRDGVKDADLVIIAAPVSTIPVIAGKIAPYLKKGAIVTDAGSVKGYVVGQAVKVMPKGVVFVGSHPMAGSEKSGVSFAVKDLFKGAVTIVTKNKATDKPALYKVKKFWQSLGSRVMVMDPARHDRTVALVSHLPHLLAQELCIVQDRQSLSCAAGGFKDMTRIAASDPVMWRDIFMANKTELVRAIEEFSSNLDRVKGLISRSRHGTVISRISRAKQVRESL